MTVAFAVALHKVLAVPSVCVQSTSIVSVCSPCRQ